MAQTTQSLPTGSRVLVNDQPGVIRYRSAGHSVGGHQRVGTDLWYGVQLDGEGRVDEYPIEQVSAVAS